MGRAVQTIKRECRDYCSRVVGGWNRFWFTPQDPFSLCVIRILVGWMSFYTIMVWGLRLESMFNVDGFNSMQMIEEHLLTWEGPYALSFWYYVPEQWVWPVHYASMAVAFCFMIGLFTRVTSVLTLVAIISYAYRARYANYGLDQINAILVLYLCIAPSGAYLSVDRWLKKLRSKQELPRLVQPTVATNLATRMTQLHYCVIYFAAGVGKLYGETWWNGTAMWRGLANAEYQTLDLTWMAHFPWFTDFLTHLTIAWEVSFAFLIWRPIARPWVMFLGLGMHFGIGLLMGMWTFATCMMFGYLVFVSPLKLKAVFDYLTGNYEEPTSSSVEQIESIHDPVMPARTEVSQIGSSSSAHIILVDRGMESAEKTVETLISRGYEATIAPTITQLLDELEMDPQAGVIVNLQNQSDADVETYFSSLLQIDLRNRPSVTLMRNRHSHWIDRVELQDYQRILLLPCDRIDVLNELETASHYVDSSQSTGSTEIAGSTH